MLRRKKNIICWFLIRKKDFILETDLPTGKNWNFIVERNMGNDLTRKYLRELKKKKNSRLFSFFSHRRIRRNLLCLWNQCYCEYEFHRERTTQMPRDKHISCRQIVFKLWSVSKPGNRSLMKLTSHAFNNSREIGFAIFRILPGVSFENALNIAETKA